VYIRRRIAAAVLAALLLGGLGVGSYSLYALQLPLPAAAMEIAAPELTSGPAVAAATPDYGSSGIGVVGWDAPLVVAGDTKPRPIASISKVVTALVVLQKLPIAAGQDGPTRTLTQADEDDYEAAVENEESRAPAPAGSTITERDALEAMLIASSNNHARLLVRWAFGSTDAFVAAAKTWLAAHGLSGTTIVEPTGVSPRNVSTIPDLIEIGELAIADPVLGGIVAQSTAELPQVGEIETRNTLLGIDGIDGIKTGTLDEAGACLLFSADIAVATADGTTETLTLVGAVLGGVDHPAVDASVTSLLDSVKGGFEELRAVTAGDAFGSFTTDWGASARAVAAEGASFLVWGPERPTVEVSLVSGLTTADSGTKVGTATITTSHATKTVALVLDGPLADPGAEWRWTHPGRAAG